ncbi:MAG: pyridoxamine 5'-phosphate oxidase family protein [Clostridia bacterium]|nr:pyridoxamine 5'-phosphate oxidase family protein [Clostridia bacterium]MBR0443836.1 pyridoxamine 5'-phosphate oxidase family protein [Clostridia bacterium]
MFRKMRRFRQQLSAEECVSILKMEPRGVLSVIGEDGYPYGMPVNQYYDDGTGKLYFHGAGEGHKIDAIRKCDRVSFCTYDRGFRKEGEWALNIRSVIVFGRIRIVEDREQTVTILRKLGLKHYPDAESVEREIEKDACRAVCLEMTVDHMTGKLVNES